VVKSNYYALAQEAGAFVVSGGDVDTLVEVDEALAHARAVPEDQRGDAWAAWVDGLLEQRRRLTSAITGRETRILRAPETR